jgi:bifunctional non-homologous end joining protein LigD
MLVVDEAPKISTVARPLGSREGKVYVDWGQNGHGQTIVAPFSVRPLPEAPVSFPLRWKDVGAKLDPRKFTIRTAAELMERRGDPLAPVLGAGIDMAGAIAAIEKRLRG